MRARLSALAFLALVSALVVAGVAFSQGYQPETVTSLFARLLDLKISAPLTLSISASGNDTNPCTPALPCATFQPACNQVAGREIQDDVVIQATSGWSGTGCYLLGMRPGQHSLPDGGVKQGSLRIRGTRAAYAPPDGGTGAGTISAATAGNRSSCAWDTWTTGGGYNADELANKWVLITSGTGSDTDHLWPIRTNTSTDLTLEDNGRATQPVNGSRYQIYDAPSATITGGLGQGVTLPLPEGESADVTPAFVITSAESPAPLNGAKTPKWITVEDFKVTGSATVLVAFSGPVEVVHNFSTATSTSSQLVRALPGFYRAGVHRNILTGTGRFLQARFGASAAVGGQIEAFDNLGPGPTNDKTLGVGSATSVWLEGNYFPRAGIRAGFCPNCRGLCEIWGGARRTGENDPGTSGQTIGPIHFDGTTFSGNSSSAYTLTAEGDNIFAIDQMGGPASTIISPASGHPFALSGGGGVIWAPTTVFDAGTGDLQVVFTGTSGGGGTVTEIAARTPPVYTNWDHSWAMQSGGSYASSRVLTDACQGSGTLDFASALVAACSADLTISLACASTSDTVELGVPNGAMVAGAQFQAWVSSAGTISVRHCCQAGASCDPASGTFRVRTTTP